MFKEVVTSCFGTSSQNDFKDKIQNSKTSSFLILSLLRHMLVSPCGRIYEKKKNPLVTFSEQAI